MRKPTPPKLRRKQGSRAEDIAASFLVDKGYYIIERNFSVRQGEIDLIVSNEDVLAFVEVRSRIDGVHGSPESTIRPSKIRRVVTAARYWLANHGDGKRDIRFDVVAIDGDLEEPGSVRHLPAAFDAGV